jgi:hypothetical protein
MYIVMPGIDTSIVPQYHTTVPYLAEIHSKGSRHAGDLVFGAGQPVEPGVEVYKCSCAVQCSAVQCSAVHVVIYVSTYIIYM